MTERSLHKFDAFLLDNNLQPDYFYGSYRVYSFVQVCQNTIFLTDNLYHSIDTILLFGHPVFAPVLAIRHKS